MTEQEFQSLVMGAKSTDISYAEAAKAGEAWFNRCTTEQKESAFVIMFFAFMASRPDCIHQVDYETFTRAGAKMLRIYRDSSNKLNHAKVARLMSDYSIR